MKDLTFTTILNMKLLGILKYFPYICKNRILWKFGEILKDLKACTK